MALGILAEALARVEHKLDLVLKALKFLGTEPFMQMHFAGNMCPVCNQTIDYQVDLTHNVVTRKCGCKTGKQPSSIPLIPLPGVQNGNFSQPTDPNQAGGPNDAPHRSRGKIR